MIASRKDFVGIRKIEFIHHDAKGMDERPEFLEMIREEAISITRKLRNHASLLLWCGDNECDMFYQLAGLDPGNNQITRQVLPQVVSQCDPYRAYLPSSPYISPEVISTGNQKLMPEIHLWGPRDYYKIQYYLQQTAPFVSEAGYYGCPGLSSLKRFLTTSTCGLGRIIPGGHCIPPPRNWIRSGTIGSRMEERNYLESFRTSSKTLFCLHRSRRRKRRSISWRECA